MTSQGERESGAEARTAAVLSIVVALGCALFVAWLVWVLVDYSVGLGSGDEAGSIIVLALVPVALILLWLHGAAQLIRGRRSGRWIVGVFAGLGLAASTALAVRVGTGYVVLAVLAIVLFGVILGLTVSRSTGHWLAERSPPRRR